MAEAVKNEFASSVTKRLKSLNCDYIEGMDDASVVDLIINPGKGRFYLLQWLFTRYDSKLATLLNPPQETARNDSTLQRLLTAAFSMCLCRLDDTDLIKGETPLSKQISFIDKLLDLVCTRERSYVPETSFDQSSASQRDSYMDAIVGQEGFLYMLEDGVDLLPRDIRAEVERDWVHTGWNKDTSRNPPLPNLQDLMTKSQDLSVELEKHNLTLTRLKEEVTVQEENHHPEIVSLNHVLCLALRELSQLSQGFSQCYQANVSQWCHRPPPHLADLGPAFHRVHGQLSKFTKMLEDLKAIRQHTSQLNKRIREKPENFPGNLVNASKEASEKFESCLTVLEEALHRCTTDFKSRPPLLTV
ncbi:haus augmin-like complex subunit 7 [Plakobranchus ocellatus]|uniref:Haus augmin-like complex subunit 7 n=1 Tax=Plakobranchus ocellatus TaxID=259542 RepID=A0AAV3Y1U3_9GAST|nr:haus augmin-like complex subunit 7 [Plakobranchus ocellatus]